MPLYRLSHKQLEMIREIPFKIERDIQTIFETNLDSLFGFQLVKSEFQIGGLRIDTLAFDKAAQAFVIIEFKKGANYSVVDQSIICFSFIYNLPT